MEGMTRTNSIYSLDFREIKDQVVIAAYSNVHKNI